MGSNTFYQELFYSKVVFIRNISKNKIVTDNSIYAYSINLSNFTMSDEYGLITIQSIIMLDSSLYIAGICPYLKKNTCLHSYVRRLSEFVNFYQIFKILNLDFYNLYLFNFWNNLEYTCRNYHVSLNQDFCNWKYCKHFSRDNLFVKSELKINERNEVYKFVSKKIFFKDTERTQYSSFPHYHGSIKNKTTKTIQSAVTLRHITSKF